MPTMHRGNGFKIKMYFKDHSPPHVHVEHADDEALVAIADGAVLEGVVPARVLDEAKQWIAANREMLNHTWTRFQE